VHEDRRVATAAALGQSIWASSGAKTLTDRQRNFFLNLINARRSEIRPVRIFAEPVPYWLDLNDLPFSRRTRNCLTNGNLLGARERLSSLTFADLFGVWSMGVVSILEFACMVEAALERSPARMTAAPTLPEHELLEIVAEPWADQVGHADPRFSDLFPALPQATMLEMLDALTTGPDSDAVALSQLSEAVPELRKRLEQITALPLEGQLAGFLHALSRFDGERLRVLIDRFGWGGKPSITLEEAGERLNITRERVRQLQEKVSNRLGAISFPAFMPALDEALSALADASPLGVDALASCSRIRA
jgi:hypothetical protein